MSAKRGWCMIFLFKIKYNVSINFTENNEATMSASTQNIRTTFQDFSIRQLCLFNRIWMTLCWINQLWKADLGKRMSRFLLAHQTCPWAAHLTSSFWSRAAQWLAARDLQLLLSGVIKHCCVNESRKWCFSFIVDKHLGLFDCDTLKEF